MTSNSIAIIGVMASLSIVLSVYFPIGMLFVYLITVLVLRLKDSVTLGIVIGLVSYLLTSDLIALTNVFLLPMIAITHYLFEPFIYGRHLSEGCHNEHSVASRIKLGSVAFISILIANIISEFAASIIYGGGLAYVVVSLPVSLIGAVINAILIGLLGILIQLRIQKVMIKKS